MTSSIFLIFFTAVVLVITFLVSRALLGLLQSLLKNAGGLLKGLLVGVFIIASIYLLSNPEYSDALWQEIKDRAEGIEHVERARYFDSDNS